MLEATGPNAEQIRHWNEVSGPKWVALDAVIDMALRPLGLKAMDSADIVPGSRVLDVGCGCGQMSLELARRTGPSGSVLGLDLSSIMLERARENARNQGSANITFEIADAQTESLPEGAFDRMYSRFGVMFFSDPQAAFTNLRRALHGGGRLAFVCWRAVTDNPWAMVPMAVVAQHIALARPDPHAPGPFSFADPDRVRGFLARSGYREIAVEASDETITVGGASGLENAVDFMLNMGPAGAAMREVDPERRVVIARAAREAVAPYLVGETVRMRAGTWIVTATAG